MYHQNFNPTGHLWLSALLAFLPLATLLVLLGGLRMKAHWASLASVVVSLLVAATAFKMPLTQALDAGVYGAMRSVLLVLWITFNAIWIYNMTVDTGYFAVLRRAFARISDDQRVQAIVIAFSFGALIEALAGGGSPVAICAVMLVAIGFNPIRAVVLALVADTAPVVFGGLGNPITNLGAVTKLPAESFGAMAGRQTSILAFFIPFVLIYIADGRRGLRTAWPAALTAGGTFAVSQFLFSMWNYKLCDIFAALISAVAVLVLVQFWQPAERLTAGANGPEAREARATADPLPHNPPPVVAGGAVDDPVKVREIGPAGGDSGLEIVKAFAPYAIIVAVFSIAQLTYSWANFKVWLEKPTKVYTWPGIHLINPAGKAAPVTYTLNWLSATGTLLFLSGLITIFVLGVYKLPRVAPYGVGAVAGLVLGALASWALGYSVVGVVVGALIGAVVGEVFMFGAGTYFRTIRQFNWAIVTILLVFALAFVMQYSGQTSSLGLYLASAGAFFAFLSPVVGWFGVAITGTDVGSNVLFGTLQTTAATKIGASKILLGAANGSGGVLAKMISPQNLAIGAASIDQVGQEGTIFRKVIGWSVGLLLVLCLLVYLQSTPVLGWMVVK